MADILEFKAASKRAKPADAANAANAAGSVPQTGEIVIFPGVRIERTGFSLADRLKRTAGLRRAVVGDRGEKRDRETR
jgi:hypothetical protein